MTGFTGLNNPIHWSKRTYYFLYIAQLKNSMCWKMDQWQSVRDTCMKLQYHVVTLGAQKSHQL